MLCLKRVLIKKSLTLMHNEQPYPEKKNAPKKLASLEKSGCSSDYVFIASFPENPILIPEIKDSDIHS
jgi:hypothetical protein